MVFSVTYKYGVSNSKWFLLLMSIDYQNFGHPKINRFAGVPDWPQNDEHDVGNRVASLVVDRLLSTGAVP